MIIRYSMPHAWLQWLDVLQKDRAAIMPPEFICCFLSSFNNAVPTLSGLWRRLETEFLDLFEMCPQVVTLHTVNTHVGCESNDIGKFVHVVLHERKLEGNAAIVT